MAIDVLKIVKATGLCSIQDEGRDHTQHLGFSGGGAADMYAFYSANQMLGNGKSQAAFEILMGQIRFCAVNDCQIALTGADCQPKLNGEAAPHWQVITLKAGDSLELGQPKANLITYLAIKGELVAKQWLNSQSQTLTEQKLGFAEPELKTNSVIKLKEQAEPINAPTTNARDLAAKLQFYSHPVLTLRFIPRALWHDLTKTQQQYYLEQEFTISADSNRMGYRLSADNLGADHSISKVLSQQPKLSLPVCYGTIQLPDQHSPLILMKERQTIGGYPALGTVMQTDLYRLSQMRPGEKVKFITITVEQAQQQQQSFQQRFK